MTKDQMFLEFTRTLSLLIRSGLPVQEALEVSEILFEDNRTKALIVRVRENMIKGNSFSSALEEEEIFSPLYRGMIKIGEKIGNLNEILDHLTLLMENRKKLNDKFKTAMIYPAILLLLIFSGISALIIFLIPRLESGFTAGAARPEQLASAVRAARGILIAMVGIPGVLLVVLLFTALFSRFNRGFALFKDRTALAFPFLGEFRKKRELYNLNFALSILAGCSVPLESALALAGSSLQNRYLKQRIEAVRESLIKGNPLSGIFLEEAVFPMEMTRWIYIGERTGKIGTVFGQLKTYYEHEIEKNLDRILTLIEPLTSLFIGAVLLTVIMLVVLPLLTMYGGIL